MPRRRIAAGGVAAVLACLPLVAHAEDEHPLLAPTRDVTVTYQLSGADRGREVRKARVAYADGGQRMRVDYYRWEETAVPFSSMIIDRPARRIVVLLPERHSYVERKLETAPEGLGVLPAVATMRYAVIGAASVAGLDCTDWRLQTVDKGEDRGTACVTADGVVVRTTRTSPAPGRVEAIEVSYGGVAAADFGVPEGYARLGPPPAAER